MTLKIVLCDINEQVVDAWRQVFDDHEIQIQCRSILALSLDAVVSPTNGFGFMDGGVDYAYRQFFGMQIEEKVRRHCAELPYGEMLVGVADTFDTEHKQIPFLIVAPTMRVPQVIMDPADVYLATRAAMGEAMRNPFVQRVGFPGMGTGCGMVHPLVAARCMKRGIEDAVAGAPTFATVHEHRAYHHELPMPRPGEQ